MSSTKVRISVIIFFLTLNIKKEKREINQYEELENITD